MTSGIAIILTVWIITQSQKISAHTENGKKVLTMAEYVTKEQVIDWYRPYGQTDEPIPFETLVSDLRNMKAADVATVRHGRWIAIKVLNEWDKGQCSECRSIFNSSVWGTNYCPNCGAKMDGDDHA